MIVRKITHNTLNCEQITKPTKQEIDAMGRLQFDVALECKFFDHYQNKMLSYRRETALQGGLLMAKKWKSGTGK